MSTKSFFVRAILLLAVTLPIPVFAQTADNKEPGADQVILPDISRREVRTPNIDTENFEIGAFVGLLSVEDLGTYADYGIRLAYHVSENFFVEGVFGTSTVSDETLCNLGLCLFPTRDQSLTYYALSLGYNLFPGESFLSKHSAMTSGVFLLAGVGNTTILDEGHFTLNFGIGLRVLPVDWLDLSVTIRDYVFQSDLLGTSKVTNNFELAFVVSGYF